MPERSPSPIIPEAVTDPLRLAALESYGILDTPPEAGFDDIVQLATQICDVPVALVSLVTRDRQWFKARIGFPACQTDLDSSVCAHALAEADLLVIPDLTQDPRTAANPLVTAEPFIRFYAGAPLHTPEGIVLGALCTIDTVPRPAGLSERQRAGLKALARQVMTQLELSRAIENRGQALAAKAKAEEQLRLAAQATGIGVWDLDLRSGELRWDQRVRALFGVPERGAVTYAESFLANLHPDDRADADAAVQAALDPGGSRFFDIDYRVLAADTGEQRWLAARGQAFVQDGATVRFIGTVRDITAHRLAEIALRTTEERYRFAVRATSDAIWDWDLATDHVGWNEALEAAHGHAPADVQPTGAWWIAQIHPDDRSRVSESIHAVIDGDGTAWTGEYRFRQAGGTYATIIDRGSVIRDGEGRAVRMVGAMLDVTERHENERRLRASEERLSLAFEAADAIGWWDWDVRSDRLVANEPFALFYGVDPAEAAAGLPIDAYFDAIHPDDRERIAAAVEATLAAGGAFAEEYRLVQPGATSRWVSARGRCYHDPEGRPQRFPGVAVDITEAKLASLRQAALTELGDRLRDLSTVPEMTLAAAEIAGRTLEVHRAGFGLLEGDVEHIEIERDWTSPGMVSIAGRHRFDDYGDMRADLRAGRPLVISDVRSDSRTGADPAPLLDIGIRALVNMPVHERGRTVAVFFVHDLRPRNWSEDDLAFLRGVADRSEAGVARARAEERRQLLNLELSHRMKNLLAMVQSIATQSLRGAADLAAAQAVLSGRLIALGRAHDLLMGGALTSTDMAPLIRSALEIHSDKPDRFRLDGPPLRIGSDQALSLALILHELATNAAKYGALSTGEGHVAIAWTILPADPEPLLRLSWTETGGPPVTPPSRKGFGSRFIERGLASQVGGTVDLAYPPSGVTFSLTAPLGAFKGGD